MKSIWGFAFAMLLAFGLLTAAARGVAHREEARRASELWTTITFVKPYGDHGCLVADTSGHLRHVNFPSDLCAELRAKGAAQIGYRGPEGWTDDLVGGPLRNA